MLFHLLCPLSLPLSLSPSLASRQSMNSIISRILRAFWIYFVLRTSLIGSGRPKYSLTLAVNRSIGFNSIKITKIVIELFCDNCPNHHTILYYKHFQFYFVFVIRLFDFFRWNSRHRSNLIFNSGRCVAKDFLSSCAEHFLKILANSEKERKTTKLKQKVCHWIFIVNRVIYYKSSQSEKRIQCGIHCEWNDQNEQKNFRMVKSRGKRRQHTHTHRVNRTLNKSITFISFLSFDQMNMHRK